MRNNHQRDLSSANRSDGKTDSVNRQAALSNDIGRNRLWNLDMKPAIRSFTLDAENTPRAFDMAGHPMAAETISDAKGSFQINWDFRLHSPQRRHPHSLRTDIKPQGRSFLSRHCQANTVDRNAFPALELFERSTNPESSAT